LNLIGRYIFREALVSTAIVVAVLLLIFMSNQFAETLGDAAADALPREAVLRVVGLQFVQFLGMLAPVGLLLGVLLAMARLNRDSEMTALAACGIGPARLLVPVGLLAVLLAGAVGWISLIQAPAASREIDQIRYEAQVQMELAALTPGQFVSIDSGSTIIYAADAREGILLDVFMEREAEDGVTVVVAAEGQPVVNPEGGDSMFVLRDGKRYTGAPGDARFSIEEFEVHGMPVRLEAAELVEAIESKATPVLMRSSDPESRAELAWRVSVPLSILILAVLAVPLGRSSPREGKYARFGVGLVIYIIYANSLSIARVWLERDLVPGWLGLWWVHGALFVLALLMLARQAGFMQKGRSADGVRIEPVE